MATPARPRLYHIVHVDRLASIAADGCLWCDAETARRMPPGTAIGMSDIKQRRREELALVSHPGLRPGDCVPFYFCPRSVMLYVIHRRNHPKLAYRGGQGLIVHLEADLHAAVDWAEQNDRRWAFTLSNAGSYHFEDRCDLAALNLIDWDAVQATEWQRCAEGKQAEFLLERSFPWHLVECLGVHSPEAYRHALDALAASDHRPPVAIRPDWYY